MITKWYTIVKTRHYKNYHECEVPWSLVYAVVLTGKHKKLPNGIIIFKTKSFYVLGKEEGDVLKIINAKRLK